MRAKKRDQWRDSKKMQIKDRRTEGSCSPSCALPCFKCQIFQPLHFPFSHKAGYKRFLFVRLMHGLHTNHIIDAFVQRFGLVVVVDLWPFEKVKTMNIHWHRW